jgi:hypothetical protein
MNKLILLFIGLFLLVNHSFTQNITHSEMLGRPTNSEITLKAFFDTTVEFRVKYGISSGVNTDSTAWQIANLDTTLEAVAELVINNLTPNTKYFYTFQYRLVGGPNLFSRPEHSFHTARPRGESFTFTIEADPHLDASSDTALFRRCITNQLEDNPDFMFDLGDFLMSEKLKNATNAVPRDTVPYRCKLLRSFYESAGHSVPLNIILGNHEGETGWYQNGTANNIAVWSTNYRKKYFSNPIPNNFYSGDTTHYNYIGQREANYAFEWGDALFIVLDPYWFTTPKPDSLNCWRWTLGKQQYDWLKSTLENSTATFKFVFCHQIVGANKEGRGGIEGASSYEWGGNNIDTTDGWATHRVGWYKPIKKLLEENRVTIFFHGHDHLYAKQKLDCLIYQECPQPSLPNFVSPPTQAVEYNYASGVIISNSGHLRVNVTPTKVTVDYVRAYTPAQETASRHNKDISGTYYIDAVNCYDSLSVGIPSQINENPQLSILPNPFNNQTTIQFELQKAESVTLKIFNTQGILIATLVNEKLKIGLHQFEFLGNNFPSGLYYIKLSVGNLVTTSKMVLIK